MSIKDILLYMDDSPACERRVDVALRLARDHGAHITGLFIVTHDYYQSHYLRTEEKIAAARALLMATAQVLNVDATFNTLESSIVGVGVRELLIIASHSKDLVVISQESRRTVRAGALVEHLVTGGGIPVLIVPAAGVFPAIGKRVLIAWKNGREAVRALHDALPILQRADQVTLLTVASDDRTNTHPWRGVREHLQRHDIKIDTELHPATSATLADNMLNLACEEGYDLLVMGAYSPGSRRGSRFGAAAGQILREMTIPVLLSH